MLNHMSNQDTMAQLLYTALVCMTYRGFHSLLVLLCWIRTLSLHKVLATSRIPCSPIADAWETGILLQSLIQE